MAKGAKRRARCPGCSKARHVDQQEGLKQVEQLWFEREVAAFPDPSSPFHPYADGMRRLALGESGRWFWACDQCLKAGRALRAHIGRHNIGLGTSFAAYVDRPFQCEDCEQSSVFSASEQKHWFETLQFLIWVYPKQCAPCRKKRRQGVVVQKALQEALKTLDPTDARQLEEVAELYEAMGIDAKATLYSGRARKRSSED